MAPLRGRGKHSHCNGYQHYSTGTTTNGPLLYTGMCQVRCVHRKWELIGVPSLSHAVSFPVHSVLLKKDKRSPVVRGVWVGDRGLLCLVFLPIYRNKNVLDSIATRTSWTVSQQERAS